jgi:hypothetical protein
VNPITFEVKLVPAGTGSAVWDDPNPDLIIDRFMPPDRRHGPMIGILHLGKVRPTPVVLQHMLLSIGEDARAGRYGSFSFIVSTQDDATKNIVTDIAISRDLAIFLSTSSTKLDQAEPVGILTAKDRETLNLVLSAGGTVTAAEFAEKLGIEQTTAGNRLVALNRKGYLQRVERPHPIGDQFIDPRSVLLSDKML